VCVVNSHCSLNTLLTPLKAGSYVSPLCTHTSVPYTHKHTLPTNFWHWLQVQTQQLFLRLRQLGPALQRLTFQLLVHAYLRYEMGNGIRGLNGEKIEFLTQIFKL
jgi:hypothetical protein